MSRRKKIGRIGRYISLEASEEDSEEEREEEESEDVDDVVDRDHRDRDNVIMDRDIAKRIEEKYFNKSEDTAHYTDEEDTPYSLGLMQSQLLPKINSPRLFLVRVKRGAEREIALRILGNKPNICSLVVKDGLRGYLYVEAFQKQHVLDSFGKVRGINKTKVSIVPQEEMVDALTYRDDFSSVGFGRIKKGKYKGDIASIVGTEGEMVTVRLVPRINGIKKLFNPEEFGGETIKKEKNCFLYKRDVYVNGFLEKEVLKSTVDFDVEPNFEELEQFQSRRVFEVDDKVRVTRGELIGIEGRVVSTLGNTVTVCRKRDEYGKGGRDNNTLNTLNTSITLPSDSLEKFYDVGEEVCYEGENGIVTNFSNGLYFVAIRDFTEEVSVSIDCLSKPIPLTKEVLRKERPRQLFRRDGLINKQVQIRKGKYKGHTGTVKDVYMNKCRVQINSNLLSLTLPREDLMEINREIQPEYVNSYTRPVKTQGYENMTVYENIKTDTLETLQNPTSIYAGVLVENKGDILRVEDFIGDTFFTNKGTFDRNEINFVRPLKNEDVIVMEGDYKGSKAVVLDVRDDLCIVKIKNGLIKNLSIGSVCKHEE